MDFGITQETSTKIRTKSLMIISLSNQIKSFLKDKDYGSEINHFYIGFICVEPAPGFEKWYQVRKPRYKAIDKIKMPDGNIKEFSGVFAYDIKVDFEQFLKSSEEEALKILVEEILNSLKNFDSLPKKIKSFDKECFKLDMEQFLLEKFPLLARACE
jgi:hypothetical protein